VSKLKNKHYDKKNNKTVEKNQFSNCLVAVFNLYKSAFFTSAPQLAAKRIADRTQ
jgi:hypothetical protein